MEKHERFARLRHDERGVLTFEWVLILTILIIGAIGGIAAVRDALIIEMSTYANAMGNLDLSYEIQPYESGLRNDRNGALFTSRGSVFSETTTPNEYRAPMASPRVFTSADPVHPVPLRQWAEGSGVAKGGAVGG